MTTVTTAITVPPHTHVWGPCVVKWLGRSRLRYCQVTGCAATTPC